MGYSRKKNGGDLRMYIFEETPGVSRFVTLPLEIPEKTKVHTKNFCTIVWHPLEIPAPKTK